MKHALVAACIFLSLIAVFAVVALCMTSQADVLPFTSDVLRELYRETLCKAQASQSILTSTVSSCMDFDSAGTTSQVWLLWRGAPSSAKLILSTTGVRADANAHIFINGQDIGQPVVDVLSYRQCPASGAPTHEYPFDPALLRSGWNEIKISTEKMTRKWMARDGILVVQGDVSGPQWLTLPYSVNGPISATLQIPVGYDMNPSGPAVPLLLAVPGWGENRLSAIIRWAKQANERGWLLLSTEIPRSPYTNTDWWYGGLTASLDAQRAIINAINWVKTNYRVDYRRIYIAGFSAGGGIALTMGAKYPDVFAAVLDYAGPNDLKEWRNFLYAMPGGKGLQLDKNVGCPPEECDFEWLRRSARNLCVNLKHVPIRVVHGTLDNSVPVAQSEALFDTMRRYYDPDHYAKELITRTVGHIYPVPGVSEGDLDYLYQYELNTNPPDLNIRTDERKPYYWLSIETAPGWEGDVAPHFNSVVASYNRDINTIEVPKAEDSRQQGAPFILGFDLQRMGLDSLATYTVEDYDPQLGEFQISNVVPDAGRISVRVNRNLNDRVNRQFVMYPQTSATPVVVECPVAEDTYITYEAADTPHGGEGVLKIKNNNWYQPLLKFDLDAVLADAVIKSANLDLYVTYRNYPRSLPNVILYEMIRPWSGAEATWYKAISTEVWGQPGLASGVDYSTSTSYVLEGGLSSSSRWYRFKLIPLVQQWVLNPSSNKGVVIRCDPPSSASVIYSFASGDSANADFRPKLRVVYLRATPTPRPTFTPTATASASSTPTATARATATPTATGTTTATATASRTATATSSVTATRTTTGTATSTAVSYRLYLPVIIK